VGGHHQSLSAGAGDHRGEAGQPVLASSDQGHRRTLAGQFGGGGVTDTGRGPGDQRDGPFKTSHDSSLSTNSNRAAAVQGPGDRQPDCCPHSVAGEDSSGSAITTSPAVMATGVHSTSLTCGNVRT